mgnify:CR=1 FL=1
MTEDKFYENTVLFLINYYQFSSHRPGSVVVRFAIEVESSDINSFRETITTGVSTGHFGRFQVDRNYLSFNTYKGSQIFNFSRF